MELEEFKNSVNILTGEEAQLVRDLFIDSFVDKSRAYFKDYAAKKKEANGSCYCRYLWCVFKQRKRIGEGLAKAIIGEKQSVYVLWDIQNLQSAFINDELQIPIDSVLQVASNFLLENLNLLPEDIYAFDDSLSWAVALTHEWGGRPDKRWCLYSTAN